MTAIRQADPGQRNIGEGTSEPNAVEDWIANAVGGGVAYDLLKAAVLSLISTAVFRWGLGYLKNYSQLIIFGGGVFVLLFVLLASVPGPARARPDLEGEIQETVGGPSPNSADFIVVFSINIVNVGQMQTIIKNWHVSANVSGVNYDAIFPQMPEKYKFNLDSETPLQPTAITFHSQDSLLTKALTPIQVGALLPGILFVDFHGVDPAVFRGVVDYTVTFEDVLSRTYKLTSKSSGQRDTLGAIPGLNTDLACPVPRTPATPPASATATPSGAGPFSPPAQQLKPY